MRFMVVGVLVLAAVETAAAQGHIPSYPVETSFDLRRDFNAEVADRLNASRVIDSENDDGVFDVVLCNRSRVPGAFATSADGVWKVVGAGRCLLLQGIEDLRVAPADGEDSWSGNAYVRMR